MKPIILYAQSLQSTSPKPTYYSTSTMTGVSSDYAYQCFVQATEYAYDIIVLEKYLRLYKDDVKEAHTRELLPRGTTKCAAIRLAIKAFDELAGKLPEPTEN